MNNNDIKGLLENQANLYLNGMPLREIAKKYDTSYVTIYHNLTSRLKKYNEELFIKVNTALENNKPKSVDDPDVRKRILSAVKLIISKDMTVGEISKELGSSFFVTYRDLSTRLIRLHKTSPELVTKDMLDIVNSKLKKHSMDNLSIEIE